MYRKGAVWQHYQSMFGGTLHFERRGQAETFLTAAIKVEAVRGLP
jgi:hypothetical protein